MNSIDHNEYSFFIAGSDSTSKLNGEYDRPCRRPFFVWDLMMRQKQNESSCTCAILPTTGSVAPVVHSTGGGQLSAVRRRPQLRQGNTQTKPVVRRAAPDRIGSNGSALFFVPVPRSWTGEIGVHEKSCLRGLSLNSAASTGPWLRFRWVRGW